MNKKVFFILVLSIIMLLSGIALSEQQQPELEGITYGDNIQSAEYADGDMKLDLEGTSGLYHERSQWEKSLTFQEYKIDDSLSPFLVPYFDGYVDSIKIKNSDLINRLFNWFPSVYCNEKPSELNPGTHFTCQMVALVYDCASFLEDEEDARNELESIDYINDVNRYGAFDFNIGDLKEEEYIYIDGHLARLCIFNASAESYFSCIIYARNDKVLVYSFAPYPEDNAIDTPIITMEDLHAIAGLITYDELRADCKQSDGEFTLRNKDGKDIINTDETSARMRLSERR